MKQGRKFWLAVLWGGALLGVLLILLAFGVRSETIIIAWLTAFVAIPVQFGVANAVITRKALGAGVGQRTDTTSGIVG